MTATDCGHRAILVEVSDSVKVACLSTTATNCKHRAITYSGASICAFSAELHSCYLPQWKYRTVGPRQPQTEGTELSLCYLFWWKYLCKWLVGQGRHRLKVHSYLHTTYSGGSICVSGLSVHTVTYCSHRAITMPLIVEEVLVKVACQSTSVTD